MVIDLLISAVGGASIALGVAAFLSKSFIKLQTDKALAIHMQTLALQKDRLSHDLAVEFHRKSISLTRQEADRIAALKHLYHLVLDLSDLVVNLGQITNKKRDSPNFSSAYFATLMEIFSSLNLTFMKLKEGFLANEKEAIYLEPAMEKQIHDTFLTVQKYYLAMQANFDEVLVKAKALGPALSEQNHPGDLKLMCAEKVADWSRVVGPTKHLLKQKLRAIVCT